MFKRILNLIRQDWTNALRDNILLYMIFAPVLLAFGARVFLPSLDAAQYTFAVQAGMPAGTISRLEKIGRVEIHPDSAEVHERVLRSDDVPGLVLENGLPLLVFEGNEGQEAETLRSVIDQALAGGTAAAFTHSEAVSGRSLLTEYTAIVFIMLSSLLGSLVMAFNIIEDKESGAVRALGVSPLSMLELTLARGLFALTLNLVLVSTSMLILLGGQVNYGLLLAGFGFSAALAVLTGYVVGGLADSQLKAIAILKLYVLVFLTLPIAAALLPRSYHVYFYILPNYWMWQTFEKILIGNLGGPGFWLSGVITLVSSLALVILLLPVLRRQLKLR